MVPNANAMQTHVTRSRSAGLVPPRRRVLSFRKQTTRPVSGARGGDWICRWRGWINQVFSSRLALEGVDVSLGDAKFLGNHIG